MIDNISNYVIQNLIQAEKIHSEDSEVYRYGLERVLSYIVNFTTTLVIGIWMGQILECILLHLLFVPLRSHAGGYHAPNPLCCYVLSVLVTIAQLLGIWFLPEHFPLQIPFFILFFSSFFIAYMAPVGTPNKPLDKKEKAVYGYRTKVILGIEVVVGILCYVISWEKGIWIVSMNTLTIALSLLIGMIATRQRRIA